MHYFSHVGCFLIPRKDDHEIIKAHARARAIAFWDIVPALGYVQVKVSGEFVHVYKRVEVWKTQGKNLKNC